MGRPIECPKCGMNKVVERQNLVFRHRGEHIPTWISMWASPIWLVVVVLIIGVGVIQSATKGHFFSAMIGVILGIVIVVIDKKAQQFIKSETTTLHRFHCHACGYSWELHNE